MARALFLLALAVLLMPAMPARADDAGAWPVTRQDKACYATGPSDGESTLTIAYFGAQPMLTIESRAFPVAAGSQTMVLRFDDGPVISVSAQGSSHVYGAILVRDLATQLRGARLLTVTIEGSDSRFPLAHAAEAMDSAARCAGAETFPEAQADQPVPIAGAQNWRLKAGSPATGQCTAIRNGDDVDILLSLTPRGLPMLVVGNNGWNLPSDPVDAGLWIDSDAEVQVGVLPFTNVVFVKDSDALIPRLRRATTLTWRFSWGTYHADITGLGVALDALAVCRKP